MVNPDLIREAILNLVKQLKEALKTSKFTDVFE
jgi:hypothetical protein